MSPGTPGLSCSRTHTGPGRENVESRLIKWRCMAILSYLVLICTHDGLDHAGPLETKSSHGMEDVHHPLGLQPLQQGIDSYECASTTTPTTRGRGGSPYIYEFYKLSSLLLNSGCVPAVNNNRPVSRSPLPFLHLADDINHVGTIIRDSTILRPLCVLELLDRNGGAILQCGGKH